MGLVSQSYGGHSGRETPGPIPNPEAKPASADGTALVRVWESRSPPNTTSHESPESPSPVTRGSRHSTHNTPTTSPALTPPDRRQHPSPDAPTTNPATAPHPPPHHRDPTTAPANSDTHPTSPEHSPAATNRRMQGFVSNWRCGRRTDTVLASERRLRDRVHFPRLLYYRRRLNDYPCLMSAKAGRFAVRRTVAWRGSGSRQLFHAGMARGTRGRRRGRYLSIERGTSPNRGP